jgi:(p)ppGpp synthase/HD superfamily hydrolase
VDDTSNLVAVMQRAQAWHGSQMRKGTSIPYMSHLLAVASLVMEDGGDDDQVAAALLHDAAEDQGGEATLMTIRAEFGDVVERRRRGGSGRNAPSSTCVQPPRGL